MKWVYKTRNYSIKRSLMSGKFDQAELDRQLNRMGLGGWELVSLTNLSKARFIGRIEIVAVFKKQLKDEIMEESL